MNILKLGLVFLTFCMYLPYVVAVEILPETVMRRACRLQVEAEEFPSACLISISGRAAEKASKSVRNEIGLSCIRASNKSLVPLNRISSYLSLPNLPHKCRQVLEQMKKKREYRDAFWGGESEPP